MIPSKELQLDGYVFSTDKNRLDKKYIHNFLSDQSYWAAHIPEEVVATSIQNSLCVGVYKQDRQIGFARIVTDYATFGYLADVFIDDEYRGQGLSKKLIRFILDFDFVVKLRRFLLGTRDAHGLYQQFGFSAIEHTDRFMEIHQPDIYLKDRP